MVIRKIVSYLLIVFIFLSSTILYASTNKIDDLISRGGYLSHFSQNEKIVSRSLLPDTRFTPASTTKIITAMIALDRLGKDYRFKTDFYYTVNQDLIIIGHGDPMLVSEEVLKICTRLKELGVKHVNRILIGGSDYGLPLGSEDTLEPYEAKSGILSVNFNSMSVKIQNGVVVSDEKQTPTLPIMAQFKNQPNGKYRFNINKIVSHIPPESIYAGQLFKALLEQVGINVGNRIEIYSSEKHGELLEPILKWASSFRLEGIIKSCLRYSNNFIANQLFLTLSNKTNIHAWAESQQATARFLEDEIYLATDEILLMDGAGLSRENYITPRAMVQILDKWSKNYKLLKRDKQTNTYYKTGTLTGVYCLAGYNLKNSIPEPFAIFLNQDKNNRKKVLIELLKNENTPPN